MTTREEREMLLGHIQEAMESGVSLQLICDFLGLSERTVQRWKLNPCDGRKGSVRVVHNKLAEKEKQAVIDTANLPEYRSLPAAQIVAILAEKGIYLASERSFYRYLKEAGQLVHRASWKKPVKRERPSHRAHGPGQMLSWDITYLRSSINGVFFYLYVVMDVWSRKIVAWEIHSEESSALSASMMERLSGEMDLRGVILHADNGSPMKGSTMLMKLHDLGVMASFSRPRVSEDNPYSESLFRTMKYRPGYPKRFSSLAESRKWVADFVHWYNHEHRHSGIGYVTPDERHTGMDVEILQKRSDTFRQAREKNPERWSRGEKTWIHQKTVVLGSPKVA